jgi:uncharacterized protein YpuA (DUF1002 family)
MYASSNSRRPVGGQSRLGQALALFLIIASIMYAAVLHSGSAQEATTLISMGESNTDAQRAELLGYFGNPKDAAVTYISVEDTRKAMADIVPDLNIGTANSSAALTCLPLGDGLEVNTINITSVTPAMYAIALVTAGVGDARLTVASPADAPAGGLTALAGIFDSWNKVQCESSQTTPQRQELALRQLALVTEVSTSVGQSTGYAGAFVIDSQRVIVINNYTTAEDISAAIANQEAVYNITVPAAQREKLVNFFVDLQKQKIDWSTFSAGWTIEYPETTRITMKGDGVAIQNAQMTATARAADNMTATARAEREATKDAKRATQTAEALAKTQTAEAMPTATATPTPGPNDAAGTLESGIDNGQVAIKLASGDTQTFNVAANATLTRNGDSADAGDFKKGDSANLKIDSGTGELVAIDAQAAPSQGTPIAKLLFLLPVLLLIPLGIVVKGRTGGDAFVVKRVAHD